jgi:hypothetical protein
MGLEKKLVAMVLQFASLAQPKSAQHSVLPTLGTHRVFKPFSWLEIGSGKMGLPHPTPSG